MLPDAGRPAPDPAPDPDYRQVSAMIAETLGLYFAPERYDDLHRGLAHAAPELGFPDAAACADWLRANRPSLAQLDVLATHLTVGETYFFRERETCEVFAQQLLPALIEARRASGHRSLRLWSAGCCTGEEAYTLATLVRELLPDLAAWQVTIRATDLNPRFLKKAVGGVYTEWSFRAAPAGFRERNFLPEGPGRWRVRPEIHAMVTFGQLNFATDTWPSPATGTDAMDVIFCRNVLMYFSPAQARQVVARLHGSLVEGGWLAVGPSETSQILFAAFATRNFPGVVLYQKDKTAALARVAAAPALAAPPRFPLTPPRLTDTLPARFLAAPPVVTSPASVPVVEKPLQSPRPPAPVPPPAPARTAHPSALASYDAGHYTDAIDFLLAPARRPYLAAPDFALLGRAWANLGRMDDALVWCDRWIGADKLNPFAHYLRATILIEHGDPTEARLTLQRALYLQPDFALAHFTAGNLSAAARRPADARRHYRCAREILARQNPDEILPESGGLTVRQLDQLVAGLVAPHPAGHSARS